MWSILNLIFLQKNMTSAYSLLLSTAGSKEMGTHTHTHKPFMPEKTEHPVLELWWVSFMAENRDITCIQKTVTKKLIHSKQNYDRFAPQNRFALMCDRDFKKPSWNKDFGT